MRLSSFVFIFCALISSSALAQANRAVPAKKLLMFYETFIGMPEDLRDGMVLNYYLKGVNNAPLPRLEMVNGNSRSKVELDKNGKVLNLPNSLSALRATKVEIFGAAKVSTIIDAVPVMPLQSRINVSNIQNSLNDYRASVKAAGAAAALIAPKINSIVFKGVSKGEAVFANGTRQALPKSGNGVIFTNTSGNLSKAQYVEFSNAPISVEFEK